uniref:RING-type domain-containing protein n=1 Tax=Meloidogyne hapla TaxID=6305 RepID=A0A1I8AYN6_MELHA
MTTIQKIRVKDAFKPNHLPPSSSSKNLQSTLQSPHDLLTSSHIHPPSSPKSLPAEASSHLPIPSSSSIHPQDPPPTNSHQIPHSTHHPPSSSVTHPSIPSSSSVHPQDPSPSTTLHQSPPSPHHKTSISISELTPSIEALPEDKLEAQEREKTMPDEIRAVINEITWKEHISTPNSPLNQFLTPQGSPHGFRCILCQYDYIPGFDPSEQIAQLKPCNHKFHLKCFAEFWWGKGKKHCPLCNQHFVENKGQEKDEVVKMEESDVC